MKNKKNYFFLFTFCISFCLTTFSQIPIKFRKAIGSSGYDEGYSAKQTFDKGYIIGGSTSSFGNGATDMYLLKTNEYGIPKRQAMFGGINVDVAKCVRQTADSGYVLLGYTNSYGAGGYDVYLVKTDSLIDTLWTRTYGGADWDFGNCIEPTTDGGYIVCGYTYSYGNGDADYYLLKLNAAGDTVWTKTYGGTNEDEATSVVQTSDGGYILTGTSKSMGDTLGDMYTIKTDVLGNVVWTNLFGGLTSCPDKGNDILQSKFGGYVLAGETQMFGIGNTNGVAVKLNANGVSQMDSLYQTYAAGYDNIESIVEDNQGNLAMAGRLDNFGNGDAFFTQIKKDWSFYSATNYGGSNVEYLCSIDTTNNRGFILCGVTTSFNNFLDDIYLIKTDTVGLATTVDNTCATGIDKIASNSDSEIELCPNPASQTLSITFDDKMQIETIDIYDILGTLIKSFKINKNYLKLINVNIEDLDNGIYFITCINREKTITKKVIVQH